MIILDNSKLYFWIILRLFEKIIEILLKIISDYLRILEKEFQIIVWLLQYMLQLIIGPQHGISNREYF